MTPTEDDVRRAKAWAACQVPPVEAFETNPNYGWEIEPIPDWLIHADEIDHIHSDEEMAWQVLATALKPVIDSVRPVIEADALERAAGEVEKLGLTSGTMVSKIIRSLIPPVTP